MFGFTIVRTSTLKLKDAARQRADDYAEVQRAACQKEREDRYALQDQLNYIRANVEFLAKAINADYTSGRVQAKKKAALRKRVTDHLTLLQDAVKKKSEAVKTGKAVKPAPASRTVEPIKAG